MRKFHTGTALAGVILALGLLLPASAPAAAAESSVPRKAELGKSERSNPDDALRESERSLGLQTRMPTEKVREENPRKKPPPSSSGGWSMSQQTASFTLWTAGGIMLVVLLLGLRKSLWSNSRSRKLGHGNDDSEGAATEAAAARMDKAQFEADIYAERGDYAEAMHVLLLQSVSELRRRLDVSIASSLTSREILRHIGLSAQSHAMFSDIIGRVEVSYFGNYRPGPQDYQACRRSYEGLAASLAEPHATLEFQAGALNGAGSPA